MNLDWGNPCSNVNGAKGCPEDKQKHTALCREIRSALNRQPGRTPLFTVAAGFDRCFPDSTRMDLVQEWVDLVFVETFDMRGPFQVLTGHHTNLYLPTGDIFSTGINISVENLFAAGVPKEKLVVGMSFHSQKWEGVPNRYNGFLQIAGTRGVRGPGYEELCRDYVGKNGFVRYWDTEGKAPYLFDGKTFLSYEDEESVEHKCGYVTTQGLGGLFWREPERDMSPKLLAAAFRGLTQSCLERKG